MTTATKANGMTMSSTALASRRGQTAIVMKGNGEMERNMVHNAQFFFQFIVAV